VVEPPFWSLALGASQIARRDGAGISFTLYGLPIMVLSLAMSSVYLYVRYMVLAGL